MAAPTIQQILDQAIQLHKAGRLAEAERLYRRILSRQPENVSVIQNLGILAGQLGRHETALELNARLVALRPNSAAAQNNFGSALQSTGRFVEAVAAFRNAIALKPDYFEAHYNLGNALKASGNPAEAIAAFRRAIELRANVPEFYFNLALALSEHGQLDEAVAVYRQAIGLRPNFPEALSNLGNVLKELGRLDEAIAAHRQALAFNPNLSKVYYNLGAALQVKGRLDEAIAAGYQAIRLDPAYAEGYNNLGLALKEKGQFDEAIQAFRQAIALRGNYEVAHSNLGNVLRLRGQLDEAIVACRKATALRPESADAQCNLGTVLQDTGQIDEAMLAYRKAIALKPTDAEAHSTYLFALHYLPDQAAEEIAEEHRVWNTRHAQPLAKFAAPHPNNRDPQRPLKIGYISADFCGHSVARFFENLLRFRDRNSIQTCCYSNPFRPDSTTARLQELSDHWRNIAGINDADVAEMIRQDGIDILVDLSGHTARNRLLVLARKPAPIQVTYLGYPDTTGMSAMDFRLTDEFADPRGKTDAFYSERLEHLPRTFLCYRPSENAPPIGPCPVASRGKIAFGSFNALPKINAPLAKLWSRILREVPGSVMVLKNRSMANSTSRQTLTNLFAAEGINAERIELLDPSPDDLTHLQSYSRMDIALDTYPYHGTTTTCEALWMGVATVTLAGPTHASRVGVSILSNTGLPDLIAASPHEYVQTAVALAQDKSRLAQIRATIREQMRLSPLMDGRQFTMDVEDAYRKMWRTWCSGER